MTVHFGIFRAVLCLLLAVVFVASPVTVSFDLQVGVHVAPTLAFAKSGSSGSGSGGSGGSGSGSSGSGSSGSGSGGSGSGGSGSGGGDDDDDDDDSGNSGSGSGSSGGSPNPVTFELRKSGNNLRLKYSNGWEERIQNGRYRLKDPEGRTVSERPATPVDVTRMLREAGQ